jgi:lysophospholipase L1-like esterase
VNLLILGFGGNEADDPMRDPERYVTEFRAVIRHMRTGSPEMACLVFAPLDQGTRDDSGRVRTMESVPLIVESQARAAREEGCAFYNTFDAMGGEGSMGEWWRSRPRLSLSDFRHATPTGYEVIANMFYKALLEGFDGYLQRSGE